MNEIKRQDMNDMNRHMDEANEELAQKSMTLNRSAQQQLLKKRAQQLAKVEIKTEVNESPLDVVEFRLAQETYALECHYIREVSTMKSIVPIPGTPGFVLGIINIRGQLLSVIDLGKFFELPAKGLNEILWVIVLKHKMMEFGIIAEEILGASSIPVQEIQPPLPTLTGIRFQYLKGIAKNQLIILDAAKILADEKMIINQGTEI